MARSTPKKKPEATKSTGNILSFFKTDAGVSAVGRRGSDVKPEIDKRPGQPSFSRANGHRSSQKDHKGKQKADLNGLGSAGDPLVISDDDEPSTSKRRKVDPVGDATLDAGPFKLLRSQSSSLSLRPEPTLTKDITPFGPEPPPTDPILVDPPDPFPNLPGFTAPPTWPSVVNTGGESYGVDGEDDAMEEEGESADHDDADGSQKGMNDEVEDSLDDTDDIVGIDAPMDGSPAVVASLPSFNGVAIDTMSDLGMDWHEPEDEGMGMDEDGDEDVTEIVTPPPRSSLLSTGKVTSCPICKASMKGKAKAVSSTIVPAAFRTLH